MAEFKYRPIERLKKKEEIRNVLRHKGIRGTYCIICIAKNDKSCPRLGIIVGRKSGNAVQRNRIKRLFREVFRHIKTQFSQNVDVVVRSTPNTWEGSFSELYQDIWCILRNRNLIEDKTDCIF